MPEESATPALVELVQRVVDAGNAREIEAEMSLLAPDSVFDLSGMGLGIYEGAEAIRKLFQEWWNTYQDYHQEAEEIRDLGNGIAFVILEMRGRPPGSTGWVEQRYANIGIWANGLVERTTNTFDIDEARAAAERLVESRG
jgi:ketosteroid isomerase-like protein